jgi:hypothetical protein
MPRPQFRKRKTTLCRCLCLLEVAGSCLVNLQKTNSLLPNAKMMTGVEIVVLASSAAAAAPLTATWSDLIAGLPSWQ